MQHSTKPPTKAQQKRFERIQSIGCVACVIDGIYQNPPEIHHLVSGKKRLGHDYTVGLCCFHHRAVVPYPYTYEQVREASGPSYAMEPEAFKKQYGTQEELLEFQNALLDHYVECERQDEE